VLRVGEQLVAFVLGLDAAEFLVNVVGLVDAQFLGPLLHALETQRVTSLSEPRV
jgi:hypothetical protein